MLPIPGVRLDWNQSHHISNVTYIISSCIKHNRLIPLVPNDTFQIQQNKCKLGCIAIVLLNQITSQIIKTGTNPFNMDQWSCVALCRHYNNNSMVIIIYITGSTPTKNLITQHGTNKNATYKTIFWYQRNTLT